MKITKNLWNIFQRQKIVSRIRGILCIKEPLILPSNGMLSIERIRKRIDEMVAENMKENLLKDNIYTYREPINFSEGGLMLVYNSDDEIGKNREKEVRIRNLIAATATFAFLFSTVIEPMPPIAIFLVYVFLNSLRYARKYLRWMQHSDVAHSMLIDSKLHVYLTLPFDHNTRRIVPIYDMVKRPLKDMNDSMKYICVGVAGTNYLFEIAAITDLTLFNTIIDPQVFAITLGDEENQNLNAREEESP